MNALYLKFLKKYIFRQKKLFVFVCIVTVLQSMVTTGLPFIYKSLIDTAILAGKESYFIKLILLLLSCYLLVLLMNVLKDYLLAKVSENLRFDIRKEMHDKISVIKYSYFSGHSVSDILSKYNKEVDTIKENCGYMTIKILSNLITFVLASAVIVMMEWRLLLFSAVIIAFYLINSKYWGKKVKELAEKSMVYNEEALNTVTENYNNVLVTKLYSAYDFVNRKFQRAYQNLYDNQLKLELLYSVNINSGGFLIYLLTGIVWLIGGLGVFAGTMTIGVVTALTNYNSMLLGPVNFFSEFNNGYQGTLVAMRRIMELLEYEEEELRPDLISENEMNRVVFENVVFRYHPNMEPVLENVSFQLEKGKVFAFMGGSGCGKSTLVKLLLHLYTPEKGEIWFGDREVTELNLESLRGKIAFVPQESHFYKGSILENLEMGREVKEEKLVHYSRLLDLLNEIENLPEKWSTGLNSGTSNLSGGQKKRLDILRALLRDRDMLIFDESTASLDVERRKRFFEIIDQIKKEKIVIFISHNIEELEHADKIYAVKNKKIYPISHQEIAQAY